MVWFALWWLFCVVLFVVCYGELYSGIIGTGTGTGTGRRIHTHTHTAQALSAGFKRVAVVEGLPENQQRNMHRCTPHHTTPHHTTPHHTTPHHTTPHHTIPRHHSTTTPYHTTPHTHHAAWQCLGLVDRWSTTLLVCVRV